MKKAELLAIAQDLVTRPAGPPPINEEPEKNASEEASQDVAVSFLPMVARIMTHGDRDVLPSNESDCLRHVKMFLSAVNAFEVSLAKILSKIREGKLE